MNTQHEPEARASTTNRPWAELKSGALKAVIWENRGDQNRAFFSTTLVRLYQDAEKQWKESHSLGRDELLRAANLLTRAFDQIEGEERRRRVASRADGGQAPNTSANGHSAQVLEGESFGGGQS